LLLVSTAAIAENPVESALSNLPIEQLMQFEVDSAAKHTQKISDVPAVVSIVTGDDIKTYGYRNLAEVLNSIRGLYVSGDRNYSYLGVRGFAVPGDYNTRVLMLVDGVRYNDSVYDQASIGNEFNIDIDLIERVEFISGPASSVYGSNALFGVINIVTRGGNEFRGVNIALGTESYRTGKARATLGDTTAAGGSWLLSLTRYSQHGQDLYYAEFDTPDQNNGKAEDADYDRSTTFFGKYEQDNLSVTLTQGERVKGIPTAAFEQVFNDNRAQTIDTRTNLGVEYKRVVNPALSFTGRLYSGRYVYRGDYIYADPLAFVNRDEGYGNWTGGEAQLSGRFERHNVVAGMEYRYDARVDQSNFNVDPYASLVSDHRSSNSAGAYLQDEYAASDALLVDLGLRFDKSSQIDLAINPRVGLIYKVAPQTVLKLLYGTAFRTPNAYEMYYFQAYYRSIIGNAYHADSNLNKERLQSTELILEHALTASQRLGVSLFRNEVKDLIALMANPDASLFFANVSGTKTEGIETEWQSAWTNGIRLKTSYSWQRTKDADTGRELANAPNDLLKLNLAGPLWKERWSYGVDVRAVSSRKTLRDNIAGYALTDLTVRWQSTAQCDMSIGAYNLFERRYYDPGSSEHVQDALQQNGRTLRFKIDYWL
jgi:iron complex outermembrane receptor protein